MHSNFLKFIEITVDLCTKKNAAVPQLTLVYISLTKFAKCVCLLQGCVERDPAQHPSVDVDAQLAVVEAVHARQAAADAGQGRGRDAQDGRGLRGHEEGAGEDLEAEEGARGAERGAAAAEERHVRTDAGWRLDRRRPRGEGPSTFL